MATRRITVKGNITSHWIDYTDDEYAQAWMTEGQGHTLAVERGRMCVVVPCTHQEALQLSRMFVENYFAIRTCCHYDGVTLSLYCGEAGRGWRDLYRRVTDAVCARGFTPLEVA